MKSFAIALGLLALAAACAVGEKPETAPRAVAAVAEPGAEYSETDMQACKAAGGVYEQAGKMQWWRCSIQYSDAGKTCSDVSDCEGKCIAEDGDRSPEATNVTGTCQASDNPFGCQAEVEDGRVTSFRCVD